MTYDNQKEIDAIKADVAAAKFKVDEIFYEALDQFITTTKVGGGYYKIDVLHLPPFRNINIKRE